MGNVEFSKKALEKLILLQADIVGVMSKVSKFNSDFSDFSCLCEENHIPFVWVDDINSKKSADWIKGLKPDIIFCFGFSYILSKEILGITPLGCVGYHPAKLPMNRGRHPITWALVLGLKNTASTFFFMDETADSGDILHQEDVPISYEDNARSLYDKIISLALRQIDDFLPKLENKTFNRVPQDYEKATYWRKRLDKDSKIDFAADSRDIYNLVRGLSKPYIGAYLIYENRRIKIWSAEEVSYNSNNCRVGQVLEVNNNRVAVKCKNAAVALTEHEFKKMPKTGERLL